MPTTKDDTEKKSGARMAGSSLRMAARLMGAPLSGPLLYRVVTKRMGLDLVREVHIGRDVPPYRPLHLLPGAAAADKEQNHG